MKNKIIIILSILVILLGIAFSVVFSKMLNNREEAIRWENNYNESKKDVQKIELTLSEFKEQTTEKEDSLLKALNIKPKQVEKIVYIENIIEEKDTFKLDLKETNNESIYKENKFSNIYMFEEELSCISFKGYTISIEEPETYITSITSNIETVYVAYQERRKRKILFFNTRLFGKKETKLEVNSSCGDLKLVELDIIKKK